MHFCSVKIITMYWKDELDALYQKNAYGKRLWKQLVGNQVELLLKNNLRQVGTFWRLQKLKKVFNYTLKLLGILKTVCGS